MKTKFKKYKDLNWVEKRDREEQVENIAVIFWAIVWTASAIAGLIIEHSN